MRYLGRRQSPHHPHEPVLTAAVPSSPMLDVEFAQLSDTGRVREHNEDYVGHVVPASPTQIRTHGWLFALADGVGGQEKGEVASRTAVESVLADFRTAVGGESHSTLLPRLVKAANTRVFEAGLAARPGGAAIATTLLICALRFDRAVVAHVGDSRCYLVRRGHATALTRDHTFAGEQARLGLLSKKEAAAAPTRHVLSRSLGNDMFVSVETDEIPVLVGDVLVLCSDGLHGAVPAPQIASVVTHSPDLDAAARKLVRMANQQDGSDNVSLQLIRVRSVERVGMYRGRPYRLH
jgi:serine/threonine protein phosphatase PrpC